MSFEGYMFKKMAAILINSLLTLLSIYLIWGWLTIDDICTWSAKKGLDSEKILSYLAQDPDFKITFADPNQPKNQPKITSFESTSGEPLYPISRVALGFMMINGAKGTVVFGSLLQPFLCFSSNVNRLFCCFGIGYMTGLLVIVVEFLRKKECSQSRLILRPLAGALASCLLFIVIISGGAIIWNELAGMRGLSLGMIGVLGSLWCEKTKLLITSI